MPSEFLYKEYQLCFEQLRYYDTRHTDLLKYSFTLTTSIAAAQFTIYKVLGSASNNFYASQVFLSTIVFIASLLLFFGMLKNRVYFVMVARQINAIREYMLTTEASGFKNNQLYTSTTFPVLNLSSIHTFQLIGIALISSLFAGSIVYGLGIVLNNKANPLLSGFSIFIIGTTELTCGFLYLKMADKKPSI